MIPRDEAIALVPARAGSKRIPGKNLRPLAGHPLIAYTIAAAIESGSFAAVVVSTDSAEIAGVARHYGAETPFLRPAELATDDSSDIRWVEHAHARLADSGLSYRFFGILRPTSPFRTAETIRRAWSVFLAEPRADSLRAVEPCGQHPGKMWVVRGALMYPLLPFVSPRGDPWHSVPTQSLPPVYVQNASLELARTEVVFADRSIAGTSVKPFFTERNEGLDINDLQDLAYAEHLLATGEATLPSVPQAPFESR